MIQKCENTPCKRNARWWVVSTMGKGKYRHGANNMTCTHHLPSTIARITELTGYAPIVRMRKSDK